MLSPATPNYIDSMENTYFRKGFGLKNEIAGRLSSGSQQVLDTPDAIRVEITVIFPDLPACSIAAATAVATSSRLVCSSFA